MKRKVRTSHAPYNITKKFGRPSKKDLPQSSAIQPKRTPRENLTLHDWLTVFAWIDEHPGVKQEDIVQHFAIKTDGALIFTQSTLSRKLAKREELENSCQHSNPNALSSKHPRVVTRPDVERCLHLWVLSMEAKQETVNGAMLMAKCARFEEKLNIPMNERLSGSGWIPPFCKAYKIKEYCRHGEAASVNIEAVKVERTRLQALLSKYEKKDIFNFDETGFFPFVPPDRGLATQQMKGKKSEKFRITIGVACNADGSEKLPLCFIGRSAKPQCFSGKSPNNYGYHYYNNTKAWMTKGIFEDYIKRLDIKMRTQGRQILFLMDNFSGHYISYEPRNIRLEFFEPNMTPFQLCDAGIIRCLKAHYRKAYCLWALQLEEANERDIYKITIREAMLLIEEAWVQVTTETISHCWKHTLILPTENLIPVPLPIHPIALQTVENELQDCIDELKRRKRIIGTPLTLQDLLNPVEEQEIGQSQYAFAGGDDEIVKNVQHEMAVQRREIIEVEDGEDEDDEPTAPAMSIADVIKTCESLERYSIQYAPQENSLELTRQLRQFRIHLRRTEMKGAKQTCLDSWLRKEM
ncbi:hypothetical protein M422DRAFT_157586 [Sphaerobolus stellatus SS14]|nr:hypothetical protein M422DRAFT_157586 [Sphaerobolus stellatus SS14]